MNYAKQLLANKLCIYNKDVPNARISSHFDEMKEIKLFKNKSINLGFKSTPSPSSSSEGS